MVFYFGHSTFEIKHKNKNAKTVAERFGCSISVLF